MKNVTHPNTLQDVHDIIDPAPLNPKSVGGIIQTHQIDPAPAVQIHETADSEYQTREQK